MRKRVSTHALAAVAGLLAFAGALVPTAAATATATATEASATAPVEASNACAQWEYEDVRALATKAVTDAHPGWSALGGVEGLAKAGSVTDFQCLEWWKFYYSNPANPDDVGYEVMVDAATSHVMHINTWNSGRSFPPFATPNLSPEAAIEAAQKRGYTAPFYRVTLFAGGGGSVYDVWSDNAHVNVDSATGNAWLPAFPDLPESVVALTAARLFPDFRETQRIDAFTCPADRPYLWNRDYGSGVLGAKTPDQSVTLHLPELKAADGYAAGWPETADGIHLPLFLPVFGEVSALCTSDAAEAYPVAR